MGVLKGVTDALHANQRIFIIDVNDDVDESLQPYL